MFGLQSDAITWTRTTLSPLNPSLRILWILFAEFCEMENNVGKAKKMYFHLIGQIWCREKSFS